VTTKATLREQLSEARRAMSGEDRELARSAIRMAVLQWCADAALRDGSRIACYVPLRTEPGSVELLAELSRAGFEVIVPITLADRDLDWAAWTLTVQPKSPLGVAAISTAALILVPALAVDGFGQRLGRGGGSYDRALARITSGTPVAALLFSGEILPDLPTDDWDRPVTAAVTPEGWHALGI
jgi:5-formyltetrahydrofolate cyclo-ligase